MLKGSLLCSQLWDLLEIQTHPCFYVCPGYFKIKEDQMKNECARVVKTIYSYILDAQGQLTL